MATRKSVVALGFRSSPELSRLYIAIGMWAVLLTSAVWGSFATPSSEPARFASSLFPFHGNATHYRPSVRSELIPEQKRQNRRIELNQPGDF